MSKPQFGRFATPIAVLAAMAVVALGPGPGAQAAPGPPLSGAGASSPQLKTPAAASDRVQLRLDQKQFAKLDRSLLADLIPPVQLSYLPEITLVRCQGRAGGCIAFTYLAISDLLKEWEAPYAPDLSFLGVDEINANRIIAEGQKPNPVLPNCAYTTFTEHGLPSEALYHSNYDHLTPRLMTADGPQFGDGKRWWYKGDQLGWQEDLAPAAQSECVHYRVKVTEAGTCDTAVDGHLTVEDLKKLLLRYGPIAVSGWWRQMNGSKDEGHCMTLVGYDDTTQRFTYLNSWYSGWTHDTNLPSCGTVPYSDIWWNGGTAPQAQPGETYDDLIYRASNIRRVEYFTNLPSDRWGSPDAYTARIRIRHPWRATLNVKVGVYGRPLLTVWDTRGRVAGRRDEWNVDLDMDVPLPDYAAQCWPPSSKNRWVVRVEDCDRDGRTGKLVEFTLAHLYRNPHCMSLGRLATDTFGGVCDVGIPDPATGAQYTPVDRTIPETPNPNPGVGQAFVPSASRVLGPSQTTFGRQPATSVVTAALAMTYKVLLPVDLCSKLDDGRLQLGAEAQRRLGGQDQWQPAPGRSLGFYRLVTNTCVNKPAQWVLLGTAVTDAAGRARFAFKPTQLVYIVAAAYKDGRDQVVASSFPLTYDARVPRPRIEFAVPERDLPFPDLVQPRPPDEELFTRGKAPLKHQ